MLALKHTRIYERGGRLIKLDFKTKNNGTPVLKRVEIDNLAERVLQDYNSKILQEPCSLDVEHFSECYAGLEMDYQDLTHNQSILGMTVFNDCYIPVYDADNNKAKRIPVNEGTILIDNSLLNEDQLRRGRFTHAHEIAHWLLHRHIYTINKMQMILFDSAIPNEPVIKCRTNDIESTGKRQLVTDDDWIEWQADYMASALLMPKKIFTRYVTAKFKSAGMVGMCYEMGTDFEKDLWADVLSREIADIFDVSLTAAKIRLKNLNFIKEKQEYKQFSII